MCSNLLASQMLTGGGGDLYERKSTCAFLFTVGSTPITWNTKKQTCIALSSTKSEYCALVEAAKEAIWIRNLYYELGFVNRLPIKLYCDNQSSIKISKNPIYHSKTKHFEIHLKTIRDMVRQRQIEALYIPTKLQPADLFTKMLSYRNFTNCLQLLEKPNPRSSPTMSQLTAVSP
jgi:hypothetical protein